MPDGKKQRGVTLSADAYQRFEEAAAAQGESVAAWLTKAGEARRRREVAEATVRFTAQPEVTDQLAEYTAWCDKENEAFAAQLDKTA